MREDLKIESELKEDNQNFGIISNKDNDGDDLQLAK